MDLIFDIILEIIRDYHLEIALVLLSTYVVWAVKISYHSYPIKHNPRAYPI